MTRYPQLPALHVCKMRGKETVFCIMADIHCDGGIIIPRGFKTDFVSIPKLARSFANKMGRGAAPAVRHDWDYYIQAEPRKTCDKRFHANLKLAGMPRWRAWVYYIELRQWGWIAWRKNAKRKPEYFFEDPFEIKT